VTSTRHRPSVPVPAKAGPSFARGLWRITAAGAGILSAAGCGFLPISPMGRAGTELIEGAPKPAPTSPVFGGCAPEGGPPDHPLNRHKNRTDTAKYLPVSWRVMSRLPWPRQVGYRFRNQWTPREARAVALYEGAAVRVDGFIVDTKLEGPEATNCNASDSASSDYHLWLADKPTLGQGNSIVVEITPRVRANHPRWTHAAIEALALSRRKVRVSGWLLLDQLHPLDVGRYRATLWEVHPVTRVEWQNTNGRWISLDSLAPRPSASQGK
jgi:hypothetical protein